jgi:hypothetical protein
MRSQIGGRKNEKKKENLNFYCSQRKSKVCTRLNCFGENFSHLFFSAAAVEAISAASHSFFQGDSKEKVKVSSVMREKLYFWVLFILRFTFA